MDIDQSGEEIISIDKGDLIGLGFQPLQKERPALAYPIVWGFIISVGVCFLYTFFKGFKDGLELFKTVSSVLSMPLGYVLGFYFRSNK